MSLRYVNIIGLCIKMDIFLVTKPLQFMMCMLLSESLNTKGSLIIVDSFYGAKDFSEKEELLNYFIEVKFFDSTQKALKSLIGNKKISRLYIDSDYGIQKNLLLLSIKSLNRSINIYLYEEGNGVYRNDLIMGRIKKYIYSFLPLSGALGSSPFTNNIYVVDKIRYDALRPELSYKSICIGACFSTWIEDNILLLTSLFGTFDVSFEVSMDTCILYITNWEIDNKVIDYLTEINHRFIVKPHPYIRYLDLDKSIEVLSPGIPVEIILIKLLDIFNHIEVYHSGTSALDYIDSSRIKSIDIRDLRI